MKLFAVYVGGRTETSRTELHDMCFAIGERLEDTYDQLYNQWWGVPESMHIDCWGMVECIDGYDISLKPEPYEGEEKLWFVNLGGYNEDEFTELHKNMFVVAPRIGKARAQALKTVGDWHTRHGDYDYEIENMHIVQDLLQDKELHIHLTPSSEPGPFTFTNGYHPIKR